jgi:hypothetical protein
MPKTADFTALTSRSQIKQAARIPSQQKQKEEKVYMVRKTSWFGLAALCIGTCAALWFLRPAATRGHIGTTSPAETALALADAQQSVHPANASLEAIASARYNHAEPASALLQPEDVQDRIFEPVDDARLASRLKPEHRLMLLSLRQEFPDVDLTEVQAFHEMISTKRASFGPELTDETVDTYRAWMRDADALHREMVRLRAEEHGLLRGGSDAQGRGFMLTGFEDGRPRYTYPLNVNAAITTAANLVRWSPSFDPVLGSTIDGSGLYVNINDHGTIYEHTEFQLPDGGGSRIMITEINDAGVRDHMTHVAGTVAAWGYRSLILGMAPRVWIRSLIDQQPRHVTDYGMRYPGEQHQEINPRNGKAQIKSALGTTSLGMLYTPLYTWESRNFDNTLADFPYYVHFYAAGNSGAQGFSTCYYGPTLSKNVMTIGAVSNALRATDGKLLGGGEIAGFSSRGPTYEGRIKPDFVAQGVGIWSSIGTNGIYFGSGTSEASPNAAGSTVLLIDYVRQRFPEHYFRSSTYKALLMNTADDGGNPGPDYTYGWGLINVYAAGKMIRHHAENSYDRILREERLHPGHTWTYSYTNDGSRPIRASLAWLDVGGATQGWGDRASRLVNDLDMRIIGPGNVEFKPFVMPFVTGQGEIPAFDTALYDAPATTGDNFTDPAEQIVIPAPAAGLYTVQVSHKGTLTNGLPQSFSLAISGLHSASATPAAITSIDPDTGSNTNNVALAVLGSGFVLGSDVLLRRHGAPEIKAYRVVPVGDRIDFRVDLTSIEKGYYDVVVRAPDGTESVLKNGFLMPIPNGGAHLLPPMITSTPVINATRSTPYSYNLTTSDGDTPGHLLALAAAGPLPAGLSFTDYGNGTGLLAGTPTVSGSYPMALSVSDGSYTNWQQFNLVITTTSGPEITTETIPVAYEGKFYDVRIETAGTGHAYSFSSGPLPAGITLTDHGDGTASLSGTPTVTGSFTVQVTATDGVVSDIKNYNLTIMKPALIGFTESEADGWEDWSITVYVSRTQNHVGEVSVAFTTQDGTALAGTDYAPTNGILTWADGEIGGKAITIDLPYDNELTRTDRAFSIILHDASANATLDTSTLTITIYDTDFNSPPQIMLDSPTTNKVPLLPGVGLLVAGEVYEDGWPSWGTYSQGWMLEEKPDGAVVHFTRADDINTGITFSQEGAYKLRFLADDGEFTNSITLLVEVAAAHNSTAGNIGPLVVISPVPDAQQEQPIPLQATVSDDGLPADPGALSLLWEQVSGPDLVVFTNANAVDAVATFPAEGTYVLRLSAHDGAIKTYAQVMQWVGPPLSPFQEWLANHGLAPDASSTNLTASGAHTLHDAYIAGIDPTDPQARFAIGHVAASGTSSLVLQWPGVPGRRYNIYWSSNLLHGAGFQLRASNILWDATTITNTIETQQGYYRIDVQLAE